MNKQAITTNLTLNLITRGRLFGLLTIVALFSVLLFSGCDNSDDDNDSNLQQELPADFDDSALDDALSEVGQEGPGIGDIGANEQTVFAPYTDDGKTVAYVDLERYVGKWYEIATFEQSFQKGCTNVTATYTPEEDGTIDVLNECYKGSKDGEYDVINGFARVANTETNARLLVYFFQPIIGAPYWVIELDGQDGDQPYEFAVVGSVFKSFLWILSRTPEVSEERLELILERLEARGYDLSKLSYTPQDG